MENLLELIQHRHAPPVMMFLGGFLVLVGGYNVVRKGLGIAFWFVTASIGWSVLMYGLKGSEFDLLAAASDQIGTVSQVAPELSNEVLDVLCQKLRNVTGG